MLPADPRGRQPRRALGRRWPTACSTASSPTTRPAPPSSSASTPATSARRGAGSPRCSSGCRRCGPRPARAGTGWPTSSAGWPPPRPRWPASPQGRDRGRRRRRPGAFRAGRAVRRSTPPGCTTGTRSRRTTAGRSRRRPHAPGCAGARVDPDGGRRAAGDPAEQTGARMSTRCPTSPALPDLASRALGGSVVHANDELFAARENLIRPEPAVFDPADVRPQGQGLRRLGDPAPARARLDWAIVRLGVPGRRARRRRRHGLVHGQLPAVRLGRGRRRRGLPVAGRAGRRRLGDRSCRGRRSAGDTAQRLRGRRRPPLHPRPADHLPRRRGRAAPRARRAGARPALPRPAPSTWPRWRTAATSSTAPTRSTPRRATCSCPAGPASMGEGWENARRRDDGNDHVTVRLAAPGGSSASRSTRRTSSATRPAGSGCAACDARRHDPAGDAGWVDLVPRGPAAARHPPPVPRRRAASR